MIDWPPVQSVPCLLPNLHKPSGGHAVTDIFGFWEHVLDMDTAHFEIRVSVVVKSYVCDRQPFPEGG